MSALRYLAMALLVCTVVISGCSNEPQSEQVAAPDDAAQVEAGTADTSVSGELSPPSAGQNF